MGKITQFTCDAPNCKAVRSTINHWFMYEMRNGWISFTTLEGHESIFDDADAKQRYGCACSRGCAQKIFEAFLASILQQSIINETNQRKECQSDPSHV